MSASFVSVLFHCLYREQDRDVVKHPALFVSQADFGRCVEILLERGIRIVEPSVLGPGAPALDPDVTHALITFDDGYYNNLLAREILAAYDVPAIFYLCRQQLERGELFWWDAYYLVRSRSAPFEDVYREIQELKHLEPAQRRTLLLDTCGADCFVPKDDVSRPMTFDEVRHLDQDPHAHIGIHTASHVLLDHCTLAEARVELKTAKDFYEELLDRELPDVAYPDGNFSAGVVEIAKSLGFRRGVTMGPGRNDIGDLDADTTGRAWLQLKRNIFPVPLSREPVTVQMSAFADTLVK